MASKDPRDGPTPRKECAHPFADAPGARSQYGRVPWLLRHGLIAQRTDLLHGDDHLFFRLQPALRRSTQADSGWRSRADDVASEKRGDAGKVFDQLRYTE